MTGNRIHKAFRILLWTILIFFALGWIGLWVMSSLGGSSPELKEGLEQFFSETTGSYAEIEELNELSLYPVARMDISGLSLKKKQDGDPWLTAGHILVSIRFWDVFFSRKNLLAVSMADIDVAPGFWGPGSVELEEGLLSRDEDGSYFRLAGFYDGIPLAAFIPVGSKEDKRYGRIFTLPSGYEPEITFGPVTVSGNYSHNSDGFRIENIEVAKENEKLLEGSLEIDSRTKEKVKLSGSFVSGSSNAALSMFLPLSGTSDQPGGTILFTELATKDFTGDGPVVVLADLISCIFPPSQQETGDVSAVLEVVVKELRHYGNALGEVKFSLNIHENGEITADLQHIKNEEATRALKTIISILQKPVPARCKVYREVSNGM
jgi:hypothetical protein